MSWLSDAKIGTKIALPVTLLLLVSAAIVGVGWLGMRQLNTQAQAVIRVTAPRIDLTQQVVAGLTEAALEVKEAVLAETPEQVADRHDRFAKAVALVEDELARLNALADSDTARGQIAALQATLRDYAGKAERVFAFAAAQQDDAALAYNESDVAPLRRQLKAQSAERAAALKQEMADADSAAQALEGRVVATLLLAAALGLGSGAALLAWIVLGFVVRPLTRMAGAMATVAGGDYGAEVQGTARADEVGALARALQTFRDNGREMQRLQAAQEATEAQAAAERRAALHGLADSFEAGISGIVHAVASSAEQVQGAAQGMSAGAERTQARTASLAATSEQTSANVATVAGATEELSASIREIGQQVSLAGAVSRDAVAEAEETAATMRELERAAADIGEVVGLISSIAGQTNLLALNATIEAARAGEMGKGFAVVASEVKALATQTARATEEIAAKVQGIEASTGRAVRSIDTIGGIIQRISEISGSISAAVEQQDAATRDIATNIAQAASGSSEVAASTGDIGRAALEAGSAASQMLGAASGLNREAARLRSQVNGFLATVRAG